MKRILIFGGTADSHPLVEWLLGFNADLTLCVTSDYAQALAENHPRLTVLVGRLDATAMAALMQAKAFACVIDATHPYAREATHNIYSAAQSSGVPYFRLLRPAGGEAGCIVVPTVAQAAALLNKTHGRVLLATGSKELAAYTAVNDFARRCYPRVLPTVEAIEQCLSLGYMQSHIIAMQGPFSAELNAALFRQLGIETLITKDGGAAGGFPEKLAAAKSCGVSVVLVRRPQETADDFDAIKIKLTSFLNFDIQAVRGV